MAKFQCNVISYTLARTVDINVIVPTPTIPQSMGMGLKEGEVVTHKPKAPYPVLYLLHGGGNNQAQWTGYTKAELYAEEHQIIIVNMAGENSMYVTREGEDDYYGFVAEELRDFVCNIFPASAKPEDSYIAGLSMGAYGTLVHGLTHPENFAAMGVFSCGGQDIKPTGGRGALSKGIPAKYVPNYIIEQWDPAVKFPKIYYAWGADDFGVQGCTITKDLLIEHGADVTWEEVPGYGHEWRFWDLELERFLKWLPRTDIYGNAGKRQI